jgi:outer membrane protein
MRLVLYLTLVFLMAAGVALGQSGRMDKKELSIASALRLAEQNYPLIRAKLYAAESAREGIDLSRNSIVPSLDVTYQAELATYNNITGMLYAQGIVPMTGPVGASNVYNPVFGSAASLLLSWQPITFGQRQAQIGVAKTAAAGKMADAGNAIFQHKIRVISAYLDWVLAIRLAGLYAGNLERTAFDLKQARVLATSGLRPASDTAQFSSELSGARIDWLNAEKEIQLRNIGLAELLASDTAWTVTDTLFFQRLPVMPSGADSSFITRHPLWLLSKSQVDLSRTEETLLKKTWAPALTFWGTTYARGSGVYPDGTVKSLEGWSFSKYNYGLGFQLSFPILKFSNIHIRQQQQAALSREYEQELELTTVQLTRDQRLSDATLTSDLAVAAETPARRQAAAAAFHALQVRYKAGLINFTEIIQAQYNLIRAETDQERSYWEAWKALLYKTAVAGDLTIFLNQMQ